MGLYLKYTHEALQNMQPLAAYSVYVIKDSILRDGVGLETQESLKLFFSLRENNKIQFNYEGTELLEYKTLVISDGEISFPFTHLSLWWRKTICRIILIDRVADCEAKAKLCYAKGDWEKIVFNSSQLIFMTPSWVINRPGDLLFRMRFVRTTSSC